jgi:hypothetical protein
MLDFVAVMLTHSTRLSTLVFLPNAYNTAERRLFVMATSLADLRERG